LINRSLNIKVIIGCSTEQENIFDFIKIIKQNHFVNQYFYKKQQMINIAIIEDEPGVRKEITYLIEQESDTHIVGWSADVKNVWKLIEQKEPADGYSTSRWNGF